MTEIVETKFGKVQGIRSARQSFEEILLFKGVPYAAPPVGELRWKAPVDPSPWEGIRLCTEHACRCWQPQFAAINFEPYASDFYYAPRPAMSEDCLYLDIATGATDSGEKRPVFMWFHGGGLGAGESSEVEFDPTVLASKGVIVVSVGQRLNVFGYLALPQLSAEQGGKSGNYGLMDEIKALDWVYENIAAFGGDPECITVGGQSGGVFKSGALAASPYQKGRIKRVINQSMLFWKHRFAALQEEEQHCREYLRAVGIDPDATVEHLRSIPAEAFYGSSTQRSAVGVGVRNPGTMIFDGDLVPATELEESHEKYAAGCDYLSGINNGECKLTGAGLAMGYSPYSSAEQVHKDIQALIGVEYDRNRLQISEEQPDRDARRLAAMGLTSKDSLFRGLMMDRIFGMRRAMQPGSGRSYCYLFSHITPDRPEDKGTSRDSDLLLAWHSSELWYTFASLDKSVPPCRPWSETDFRLADQVSSYWANFIKTGDPNGEGLPHWPASSEDFGWMELEDTPHAHIGLESPADHLILDYMKTVLDISI